jgi:hypothetical protein
MKLKYVLSICLIAIVSLVGLTACQSIIETKTVTVTDTPTTLTTTVYHPSTVTTTTVREIQVYAKSISNGEEILLDSSAGINSILFTDFAFIVDFNSAIEASDSDNGVMVYLPFWKEWRDTSVQVFARDGLSLEPLPEFNPTNEVSVTIEILDDERIMVSQVSGNYPSNAQVVLTMDFGEFGQGVRLGYTQRIYTEGE